MHVGTGQLRAECVPLFNLWYLVHIFGTSRQGSRQLVEGAVSTKPPELTTRYADGDLLVMLWKGRVDARAGLQDKYHVLMYAMKKMNDLLCLRFIPSK